MKERETTTRIGNWEGEEKRTPRKSICGNREIECEREKMNEKEI